MLDIGLRQLLSATFGSVQGRERQYIIVDLTVTETPGFLRETARGDVGLTRRFTTNTVPDAAYTLYLLGTLPNRAGEETGCSQSFRLHVGASVVVRDRRRAARVSPSPPDFTHIRQGWILVARRWVKMTVGR